MARGKLTVLDHLTAPTVSPEILRVRASYWTTVAERNARHGRHEQAARLYQNCAAMRYQADLMEREPVVSIVPAVVPVRAKKLDAGRFWELHSIAVSSIRSVYGETWKLTAPYGETIVVSVPAGLRSCKGPRGGTIRWGRDHRMPAASHWPNGRIPGTLEIGTDSPRETKKRAWGAGMKYPTYAAWQDAWAKKNGLVRVDGIFLPKAEAMRLAA